MINWSKVIELREEVGAEDFEEVVELFLDEVDETLSVLGGAGRSLEHDLHFLKGSALNLGFIDFSDLCRLGEEASAAGQDETVDTNEIIACYHTSKAVFLKESETRLAR